MKSDINIASIFGGFGQFFRRFHTLVFFVVVSSVLFVAILMLLSIITLSSSTASTSDQAVNGSFDDDTILRLEQNSAEQITPGARPSPFVE